MKRRRNWIRKQTEINRYARNLWPVQIRTGTVLVQKLVAPELGS